MKFHLMAAFISLAILVGLVVLTIPDDDNAPPTMHGVRMNHARFHSGSGETFTFEVHVNATEGIYGYEEAMTTHHIAGDDEASGRLALELKSLSRTPVQDGVRLALEYSVPFETEKTHIHYDPALLEITYSDGQMASIPVGTFSYRFDDTAASSEHIDYGRITVLSGETPSGASATGACITLRALTEDAVVIEGIDPGTPALNGNTDHLMTHDAEVTPFTPVEAITGAPFNPRAPSVSPKTVTLSGGSEATLCVPFARGNTLRSERFPFVITYRHNAKQHTFVIDDVRYIRSTLGPSAEFEEDARATLEED